MSVHYKMENDNNHWMQPKCMTSKVEHIHGDWTIVYNGSAM